MERPHVATQYFLPILYRLLKSQNQEPVKQEMEKLTAGYQADKLVNAGYFNEDMISCQGTVKLSLRAFEGIILKTGGMENEKK